MGEHGERQWGGDVRRTESDDTVMCEDAMTDMVKLLCVLT